jgi:hypothetical protein
MAHFAILDESNIVTRVEVINNAVLLDGDGVEQEQLGIDFLTSLYGAGKYKQTSYNKKIRKNYAGVGYTYDAVKDKFIKSKPFASWSLDENDDWKAPITYPDDDKDYYWNEDNYQADNNTGWVEIG